MATAAPSARPLRHRLRDAVMEAMLDAAEAMMVKRGYERTTMQELAAATGCAAGTFYLYFKNKEELFQAIAVRHTERMHALGRAELQKGGEPLTRLHRMHAAMMRYLNQERPFFRMLLDALPMRRRFLIKRFPVSEQANHEAHQRLQREVLREAQERGQVRGDYPPEMLQELMESIGFSMCEHYLFSPKRVSLDEQTRTIWALIAGGIGARSGHGRK